MKSDAGSIFVDAVVCAAIVAVTLSAAFQVLGSVTRRQSQLDDSRGALLVARSELAAVGSEIPLSPGRSEGLSGEFAWRVDISPYAQTGAASPAGRLNLVRVSVSHRQDSRELARLSTLRLAPVAG